VLLQPGELPHRFELKVGPESVVRSLASDHFYSPSAYQQHCDWLWGDGVPPTERHALFQDLWTRLRLLDGVTRDQVLDSIYAWAGRPRRPRPSHRAMTMGELASLSRCALIEIGAHTLSHCSLPALTPGIQAAEIQHSKTQLERVTGCKIRSFAYPFGDFGPETPNLVRAAGMDCACSTVAAPVAANADLFALPRVEIQDWSAEEFRHQLAQWVRLPHAA
jgi:peptidoglycan/xylan/chitin deacetylase (PgdA/CDA1 family)